MNKWKSTRYPGVRYREHSSRRHGVKYDRYYAIRYQKDGKRHEEALGWTSEGWTEEQAALKLAELKRAAQIGEGPQRLSEKRKIETRRKEEKERKREQEKRDRLTFGDFFSNTYLPVAKDNKKYGSWKTEEGIFDNWLKEVIGDISMVEISPIDLERIKSNMAKQEKSSRTIKYALATVRVVINMAKRLDMFVGDNPVSKVKIPAENNKRQRFLTFEEAESLLEALKDTSKQTYKIALLALHCGLRASEVFNLKWGDVDFINNQLSIRDTKSEVDRYAYLTADAKHCLAEGYDDQGSSEYVFKNAKGERIDDISNTFRNTVEALELNEGITDRRDRVVFHTLRHTFASWHAEDGTDLYTIKGLLGHGDISMTQRYSHLGPNKLRSAVEQFEKKLKAKKEKKVVDINSERKKKA